MLFRLVHFLYGFLLGTLPPFFTAHKLYGVQAVQWVRVASCVFYSTWKWHIFKIRYPKFLLGKVKKCPFA